MGYSGLFLLTVAFAVVGAFSSSPDCQARAGEVATVRILVFSSPECGHCESASPEYLKALGDRLGCVVEARYFDLGKMTDYRKLIELESRFGDTDNEIPVIVVSRQILGGETEIEARLEQEIRHCIENGVQAWPDEVETIDDETSDAGPTADPEIPSGSGAPAQPVTQEEDLSDSPSIGHRSPTPRADEGGLATEPRSSEIDTTMSETISVPESQKEIRNPRTYVAFFYQTTCKECQRIFYLLDYLCETYDNLVIKEFDLSVEYNKVLYEAIAIKQQIPEKKRLVDATVFVGSDYLQMEAVTQSNVEEVLARYEKTGTTCPWEITTTDRAAAQESIISRFKSLGPLTVAGAGLLDGVNPCAFTTIIFFISYLSFLGKKGRELLWVGISFTAAVFLAYFLIGCGALSFLRILSASRLVSQIVSGAIALFAITLGLISLRDWVKARRGKFGDISLQLPTGLKKRIHATLRTHMKMSRVVWAPFIAGITVSLLELACTGQVYLPTIAFITSQNALRKTAIFYLGLYNLMFICPLVVIFGLTYAGFNSERLQSFSRRNLAPAKLATSIFFLLIGCYLMTQTF